MKRFILGGGLGFGWTLTQKRRDIPVGTQDTDDLDAGHIVEVHYLIATDRPEPDVVAVRDQIVSGVSQDWVAVQHFAGGHETVYQAVRRIWVSFADVIGDLNQI